MSRPSRSVLPALLLQVHAASAWLASARASLASQKKLHIVYDTLPQYAQKWRELGGGAMEMPAGGGSGNFFNWWDTLPLTPTTTYDYEGMEADKRRTETYYDAIRRRLAQAEAGTLTVLDLGTGADALLALEAARAGARKVYAIEQNPNVAQQVRLAESDCRRCGSHSCLRRLANQARDAVAAAGFSEVIEVFEGLSTQIALPEKVDVLVSEIVGSVASEEGLYPSIADAHARFVKRPTEPSSWIPHRCQTLGRPPLLELGGWHARVRSRERSRPPLCARTHARQAPHARTRCTLGSVRRATTGMA